MKSLRDILYKTAIVSATGSMSKNVGSICFDSRQINKGGLFIAVKGTLVDGHSFIKDVIKANLLSLEKDKVGIFNISRGEEVTINTVFNKINNLISLNSEKEYKNLNYKEQLRSCLDNSKALNVLGWLPEYSFDGGLKETVDWFKERS